MWVLTIALESCRITGFAGRRLRGCGSFTLASGIYRFCSTLLRRVQGGTRLLTRHGVFCPGSARGVTSGGPAAFPIYGPPCDGIPKGNN